MRSVTIVALLTLLCACGDANSANNDNSNVPDATGPQNDMGSSDMDGDGGGEPGDDSGPGADSGEVDAGGDAGTGDPAVDTDRDDDGIDDDDDAFPDDPSEWVDSDGDGVGNAAQLDEDGDGTPDTDDAFPFDPAQASLTPVNHPGDTSRPDLGGTFPVALTFAPSEPVQTVAATIDVTAGVALSFELRSTGEADIVVQYESETFGEPLVEIAPGRLYAWTAPDDGRVTITLITLDDMTSLELVVVPDSDLDGLGDDLELAFGLRPANPDPDVDGLQDGLEWAVAGNDDLDADGLPAWLDTDTDGDGLSDRAEGAQDDDDDGVPNFVDDDSDGNGTPDAAEPGVNDDEPIDFDGDGIADWRDADDDGDGLLDVTDPDVRSFDAPTRGFEIATPMVLEEAFGTFGTSNTAVPNAVRVGDALTLRGRGFSAAPVVIARFDDGEVLNVTGTLIDANTVEVAFGRPGTAIVAVLAGGAITDELVVDVLTASAPVIFPPAANAVVISQTNLRFTGENLENVRHFITDEGEQIDAFYDTFASELMLRGDAAVFQTSRIRPRSAELGNRLLIRPLDQQSFRTDIPATAMFDETDFEVSARPDEVLTEPDPFFGYWLVSSAHDRASVAMAFVGDDVVMMRSLYPASLSDMSFLTTAAAWVMEFNGASVRLPATDYQLAHDDVVLLPEVVALASALEAAATTSTDYITNPPAAVQSAFDAAVGPVEGAISARIPVIMPIRTTAVIAPGEQFDVSVTQTENTGNLTVENDTSLYLSAEVRDKANRPLQAHVTSYADLSMISPQRGILLAFYASSGDLSAPNYRNADLEVVTPGFAAPQPTSMRALDAQVMLLLRTAIDRVFLPIISVAIDAKLSPGLLVQLILIHNYDVVQDVRGAISSGSPKDALYAVGNVLLRDVENLGPITQAITKAALGEGGASAVSRVARRIAPGLGQVDAVLSAVAAVSSTINVGKAIADFATTPGMIEWSVDFGLELLAAEPAVVERMHRRQQVCLVGTGLREGDGRSASVVVTDVAEELDVEISDPEANEDGTELCFVIRGRDAARLTGPLQVEVTRADTMETATVTLSVERTFLLHSITDFTGSARDSPRLDGARFGRDASALEVRFRNFDTQEVVAAARVREAHDTWLRFEMPRIAHDQPYELFVTRLGPQEEFTNELLLNVPYPALEGAWELDFDVRFQNGTSCEWHSENARGRSASTGATSPLEFLTPYNGLEAGDKTSCSLSFGVTQAPGTAVDGMVYANGIDQTIACPLGPLFIRWDFSGHMRRNRIRYTEVFQSPGCLSVVKRMTARFVPAP